MFSCIKCASSDREACSSIMRRIYREEPSFWPHGCSVEMFEASPDADELYLVKNAAGSPVGFAGWQQRMHRGVKTGFYAIGILPEYRRNGLAKQAVSKLINAKRASVDRVEALISRRNLPSLSLACALGVPVVKSASLPTAAAEAVAPSLLRTLTKHVGMPATAGAGTAAYWDYMMHPDIKYPFQGIGDSDRTRVGNTVLNAALGVTGGTALAHLGPVKGMAVALPSAVITPQVKDIINMLIPTVGRLPGAIDSAVTNTAPRPDTPALSTGEKASLGALLGIGAVGAGYGLHRLTDSADRLADANAGGRLKVKLPTRDPNDQETSLDVPINDSNIPPNIQALLFRDTRRKLRSETRERTWHRRGHKEDTSASKSAAIKPVDIRQIDGVEISNPFSQPEIDPEQVTDMQQAHAESQKKHDAELQKAQQAQQQYEEQSRAISDKMRAEHHEFEREKHRLQMENDLLKHNLDLAKAVKPDDTTGHVGLASALKQIEASHKSAQKALYKAASARPFLLEALIKRAEATTPFKPQVPTALPAQGDYFKSLYPNGARGAVVNFAFGQPYQSYDKAYNAVTGGKTLGKDPTLGEYAAHVPRAIGGSIAATGARIKEHLLSPFRSMARGFVTAQGRRADVSDYVTAQGGWGKVHASQLGSLTREYGKSWGDLVDAGNPFTINNPYGSGGRPAAASPTATGAAPSARVPAAPVAGTPAATVGAFGPTGALNLTQRGAYSMPTAMRGGDPGSEAMVSYQQPWLNTLMSVGGGLLSPRPDAEITGSGSVAPQQNLGAVLSQILGLQ